MTESRVSAIGKKQSIRLLIALALILLLLLQSICAIGDPTNAETVDPVGHSDNCSAVLYNNTNGLPSSEANAIVQTDEGFIWIGSYSGLTRYDGSHFERMGAALGITSVVSLLADRGDRLWIGTNDSGLVLLERGKTRTWTEAEGLASNKILTLAKDGNGNLYAGTTTGISVISPDLELHTLDDPKIANAYMEHICRGSDGLIYCLTSYYDLFTLRNGEVVDYYDHKDAPIQNISAILPDPHARGKVYIGTDTSDLYYGDLSQGPDGMEHISIAPLSSVSNLCQIGNRVWICARNGIGVLDREGFHLMDGLPMDNSVNGAMADYQGNLWFTSTRQGVMKLVWNQFSDLFNRFGLPEQVVNATCMYKDRLFVATDNGLTVLDENGPVSALPLTRAVTASGQDLGGGDLLELLDGVRIRSVLRDSQGHLWLSLWGSYGLLRYDGREVTAFTVADGMTSDHIRAVCETPDGSILVACLGGADVIQGDDVIASYGQADGIENLETLSVAAAPNGDLLLGSNGGGIYVINESGVRCVGRKDGLRSGVVMRIKHDKFRNLFWLVTGNSIAFMTRDYQVTTLENFPFFNNFDLYQSSRDEMWVLGSDGIYVVPGREMAANGPISAVHYGIADGLPFTATSNSYSELTKEGDLYLAGNMGVAKVNLEAQATGAANIKQSVPYLDADGTRFYPDEEGGFSIPPAYTS